DALQKGDKIEIRGFGSFRTRQRRGRIGRNPKTGEKVEVPAKKIPFFKPSKELKDFVNTAAAQSEAASEWAGGFGKQNEQAHRVPGRFYFAAKAAASVLLAAIYYSFLRYALQSESRTANQWTISGRRGATSTWRKRLRGSTRSAFFVTP